MSSRRRHEPPEKAGPYTYRDVQDAFRFLLLQAPALSMLRKVEAEIKQEDRGFWVELVDLVRRYDAQEVETFEQGGKRRRIEVGDTRVTAPLERLYAWFEQRRADPPELEKNAQAEAREIRAILVEAGIDCELDDLLAMLKADRDAAPFDTFRDWRLDTRSSATCAKDLIAATTPTKGKTIDFISKQLTKARRGAARQPPKPQAAVERAAYEAGDGGFSKAGGALLVVGLALEVTDVLVLGLEEILRTTSGTVADSTPLRRDLGLDRDTKPG